MSRLYISAFRVLAACAIVFGASLGDAPISAQEVETAKVITPDGVKLHGIFYPGKRNAATVIMLHPIGEGKSTKSQDWKNLAETLNKAGYAVMMFDFRGHGESTSIEDPKLFWTKAANVNYVRSKDKESIEVKDFIKSGSAYLPVLVNDISAVRSYLDRRNDDSKDCNTSSIVVIGVDAGATLGALWINSEWYRFKYSPPPMFTGFIPKFLDTRAEGRDIVAAVFLTPAASLEKRTVSLSSLLKVACKDNGTAALFLYGEEDTKARDFNKKLESNLKPKKESKKHEFIGAYPLKTNLTGIKLLQKGLRTDELLVKYLDNVMEDRRNDRIDREFTSNYYVWRSPFNGQMIPAKTKKGEKNLNFDDYAKFITQ